MGRGQVKGVVLNIQNVHWVLVDFWGYNLQAEWAFTDSVLWALAFMYQPAPGLQVSCDAACCPAGNALHAQAGRHWAAGGCPVLCRVS